MSSEKGIQLIINLSRELRVSFVKLLYIPRPWSNLERGEEKNEKWEGIKLEYIRMAGMIPSSGIKSGSSSQKSKAIAYVQLTFFSATN